jgi:hypothetical protein
MNFLFVYLEFCILDMLMITKNGSLKVLHGLDVLCDSIHDPILTNYVPIVSRLENYLLFIQALEVRIVLLIDHVHGNFVSVFINYLIVLYMMPMLVHRCMHTVRV